MSAPPSPTLSDSALLDSLDDSEVFNIEKQRERKIEELRSKIKWVKKSEHESRPGSGEMNVFKDEKLLVERIAKEPYVIIHFFHPDFERCHIMDLRLTQMAPDYRNTLFVRASVADSLFLVAKFEVKVLPCVMCFVHGRCVDRLIGFEDFAEGDAFSVNSLGFRLKHSGVLPTGPLALTDALPTSLTRKDDSDEEPDSEDERWRGKTGVQRKGKTGIRNGFATSRPDEDEDF